MVKQSPHIYRLGWLALFLSHLVVNIYYYDHAEGQDRYTNGDRTVSFFLPASDMPLVANNGQINIDLTVNTIYSGYQASSSFTQAKILAQLKYFSSLFSNEIQVNQLSPVYLRHRVLII